MDIILSEPSLQEYNRVLIFLLQIKRAKFALDKIHISSSTIFTFGLSYFVQKEFIRC